MPQARAYDNLAEWFELLNDDCDYPHWSQYFIGGLRALGAGKKGLEVGCGSGAFCRALTRAGYTMTGMDISSAMLSVAARRAREEGLSVRFLQADAAKLPAGEKFDFLLSPNDCYNYVQQSALLPAFRRAAALLPRGGVFWLDVSSPYKLRNKVANNILADDRDDIAYFSFNRLREDRVETDVTLFVRQESGDFRRLDERHVQYIHEEEDVVGALRAAGFSVRVEGKLGEPKEGSDRLNFICRKA